MSRPIILLLALALSPWLAAGIILMHKPEPQPEMRLPVEPWPQTLFDPEFMTLEFFGVEEPEHCNPEQKP